MTCTAQILFTTICWLAGFWQSGRKLWAQAHPSQDHPASRRHVQHPFGAEEAESYDLAIQAAELACAAADKAMDLVFAHPKEVIAPAVCLPGLGPG